LESTNATRSLADYVKDMKDAFTFNVLTAHALTIAAVPLMLEHSGGGSLIGQGAIKADVAGGPPLPGGSR